MASLRMRLRVLTDSKLRAHLKREATRFRVAPVISARLARLRQDSRATAAILWQHHALAETEWQ